MLVEHLAGLVSDHHDGRQRSDGVLKQHPDVHSDDPAPRCVVDEALLLPPQLAQWVATAALRVGVDQLTLVPHLAVDDPGRGTEQIQRPEHSQRLATAGLTNESQHLAGFDLERHVT